MSSRHAGRAPGQPDRWASVQGVALVVGALFVLVGILGFVPGVTDYDGGMTIAGHGQAPCCSTSSRFHCCTTPFI